MKRVALSGLFLVAAVGCGGTQQTDDDAIPLTTPTFDGNTASRPVETSEPEDHSATGQMNDDQKDMIKVALRRGGDKAKNCNTVTNSNVTGEGDVQVVFDGKMGKVVEAQIGAPFAGTDVEACLKQSFVDEIVLPFEGKLTVPYTVKLEPNKNLPPPGTKKKPK